MIFLVAALTVLVGALIGVMVFLAGHESEERRPR